MVNNPLVQPGQVLPIPAQKPIIWKQFEILGGTSKKSFPDMDCRPCTLEFPERGKTGASIVLAYSAGVRFYVHHKRRGREPDAVLLRPNDAFLSSQDITHGYAQGPICFSIKASINPQDAQLPGIPLHHIVGEDYDGEVSRGVRASVSDFSSFGIPLRILIFEILEGGPYEAFRSLAGRHFDNANGMPLRVESIALPPSDKERLVIAWGSCLELLDRDISGGFAGAISPGTGANLTISGSPRIEGEGEAFIPTYGAVYVLEEADCIAHSSLIVGRQLNPS
jgi:hypothetical protein